MSNSGGNGGGGGALPPIYQPIIVTVGGASQIPNTIRQVTNQFSNMNRTVNGGNGQMMVTWRSFGDALRQTGSLLRYTVGMPLMNLVSQSAKVAMQFETSMAKIRGLVGVAGKQVEIFGDQVKNLAPQVGKGPLELAEALYFITSSGFDGAEAMDVLAASAKAASAGLGQTEIVADAVTSVMSAYGSGSYTATQATDILTAAVREGKAEADKFAPALGKILPVAAAFGLSFEDIGASVAALTRSGAEAGTAAIYLRQVLSTLLDPARKAGDELESIGLSAATLRERIQGGDLLGALVDLEKGFGGNVESMAKVFGNVRALTAVFSLLGPNLESNREIFDSINGTAGDTAEAFAEIEKTAGYKMKAAMAQLQSSMITMGDAILPLISAVAKIGQMFAKFFGIIAANRVMIQVLTVTVALTAAFLAVTRTMTTMIRIYALGQTIQRAYALGIKNIYTGTITQIKANALLRTSTLSNVVAQQTATATQGQAVVATQAYIMGTNAQTAATAATTAATATQTAAATTATVANKALGATMLTLMPYLAAAALAVGAIGFLISRRQKKSPDSIPDILEKMKKDGIELGTYTQIGMQVTIDTSLNSDEVSKKAEALKESFGDYAQDFVDSTPAVKLAIATQLAGVQLGGKDEIVTEEIAKMFNIDPEMLKSEIDDLDITDIVESGVKTAIAEADISGEVELDNLFDDYQNFRTGPKGKAAIEDIKDFRNSLAKTAGASLKAGNASVFAEYYAKIINISEKFGTNIEAKNNFIKESVKKAFESAGLKSGETVIDSLTKNSASLTGTAQDLANAFSGLSAKGTEFSDSATMQSDYLNILIADMESTAAASDELAKKSARITEAFKDGVNPELNDSITLFNAVGDAIGKAKNAQDALYTPTLDLFAAQTGLRDALRGVAEAGAKSGGSIFSGTETADKTLNSVTAAAKNVLEIANATFAATQDADAAKKAASQGIAGIVEAMTAGGVSPADIQKFYDEFENAFSAENIGKTLEGSDPNALGKSQGAGVVEGILSTLPDGQKAIKSLISGILSSGKLYSESSSPSALFAREIGVPIGQGIALGIKNSSGDGQVAIAGTTDGIVNTAESKLQIKSPSKVFFKVGQKITAGMAKGITSLRPKTDEATRDILKNALSAAIDNAKQFVDVISTRLDYKQSKLDLTKFQRTQTLAPTILARSQRASSRASRRFGANGGTEVTSYEASQIEEAQKSVNKLRRDYALGRAPLTDLIDAEESLAELRQTAAEKAPEIVDAQNAVDDAQFNVTNSADQLAVKQGEVALKYGEMVSAAATFNLNAQASTDAMKLLADGAGFSKLQIDGMVASITGTKTSLEDLVKPLKSTEFAQTLKAAADLITGFVDASKKGAGAESNLNFNIPTGLPTAPTTPIDPKTLISLNGLYVTVKSGGVNIPTPGSVSLPGSPYMNLTGSGVKITARQPMVVTGQDKITLLNLGAKGQLPAWFGDYISPRANGGPVSAMSTYLVGEKGPELFTPKGNGTIIPNTALQSYTTSGSSSSGSSSANGNNFNINVYNPTPEAASDSIGRTMRNLSYTGLFG